MNVSDIASKADPVISVGHSGLRLNMCLWLSLIMIRWSWLERLPAHLDGAHSLACALARFLGQLLDIR